MSFELSDAGSAIALDAAFGRATQSARTVYVALLDSAPTDTTTLATMSEITTAGYSRQAFTPSTPSLAEVHNTNTITFGPFSADPPNVTHFAIVSAASGTTGDLIGWGAFTAAKDAASGDSLQIAASGLSLTVD